MRKQISYILLLCAILSFSACGKNKTATRKTVSEAVSSETTSGMAEASSPAASVDSTLSSDTSTAPVQSETTESTSKETSPPKAQSSTSSKPPSSTTPPATTTPPADTTPTPAPFDVNVYVNYAREYGESIGLIYEPSLINDDSWNAPLNLYASLGDEHMRLGVRGSCNRIQKEGGEYFYPHAVKQPDNTYKLYIYY